MSVKQIEDNTWVGVRVRKDTRQMIKELAVKAGMEMDAYLVKLLKEKQDG